MPDPLLLLPKPRYLTTTAETYALPDQALIVIDFVIRQTFPEAQFQARIVP